MEKTRRYLVNNFELRNVADEQGNETEVLQGYALKFNRESEILGRFTRFKEVLDSRCLDNTDMSDVVALINHDENLILGRSGYNLSLNVDNIGLMFTLKPTNTSYARDLIENVRSGVIGKCSFAFTVAKDGVEWEDVKDEEYEYKRTITAIDKLYDVSLVTSPAYQDTEAVVGSRCQSKAEEMRHLGINPKISEKEKIIIEATAYM